VIPPDYRERLTTGIVHFGPGAFHRAHQADYVHRLCGHDPRWGIAAASLRSAGTVEALRRQNGLYTLAILEEDAPRFRTVGVHNRFLGPGDGDGLQRQFLDPAVRVVTSTVTEKGYCLSPDGTLDFDHADVRHDLEQPEAPESLIGWLSLALSIRRREGLPPLTIICCDNMNSNGRKLGAAVAEFARRRDPELARWIEGEVRFPNTMVDSITPATDEALRQLVRERTGFEDQIPVRREAYAAWVIEDVLPAGTPDLASAGTTLTGDVAAWEKAKLRILNGAHSTLAYLGFLIGHETVADAMKDEVLATFVERLIRDDIIPTLAPSALDLANYAQETLQRFRNPAIHHRLSQIAWDGSQKLPYRILGTVEDVQNAGRALHRLAVPVAAWILFLERQSRSGAEIVDPLESELRRLSTGPGPVPAILGLRQVFPRSLSADTPFGRFVAEAHRRLDGSGARDFLRELASRSPA
jgi:fructuronate reductase